MQGFFVLALQRGMRCRREGINNMVLPSFHSLQREDCCMNFKMHLENEGSKLNAVAIVLHKSDISLGTKER